MHWKLVSPATIAKVGVFYGGQGAWFVASAAAADHSDVNASYWNQREENVQMGQILCFKVQNLVQQSHKSKDMFHR